MATPTPKTDQRQATDNVRLAQAMLHAVRAQDFGAVPDSQRNGTPVAHFPSLDLALIDFAQGAPRHANVLFSREHPHGVVASIDASAGAVQNIRFDADLTDAQGESIAWAPDADWQRLPLRPLAGPGPLRFVAPYPASLLKLMVAVGVGLALDRGRISDWPAALAPMIVVSDNDATTECVALLHRCSAVELLNRRFAELGLATLQLNDTRPDGGWRNADGSGVGHIHMSAWDTARLLWLLDAEAPPPPWLPAGTTLLQPATRDHLRAVLQGQQQDHVLSSGSLRDVPGWVPGLPDAPAFAHKTGHTHNYASDAGIVRGPGLHAVVAVLTSLGERHAPDPRCATTWRLPALGAALHSLLQGST
jgi:hypothetical protein